MLKISSITPTATSSGLFTNGSVASGVSPTILDAAWFNTVQTEIVSAVEGADLTLDPTNNAQLLAAIKALAVVASRPVMTGVVGNSRNLKLNITTASATATVTADELIVGTAIGGKQYRLSNFSQPFNLGATGPGGMDAGTITTGYVALYAIYNSVTGATSLLGFNATSTVAPEVYGGSNMPSGYTASALVSVWRVASSKLVVGNQFGREVSIFRDILLTTSTYAATLGAPWNELDISSIYPPNTVWIEVDVAGVTGSSTAFYSSGVAGAIGANNAPIHGVTWPSFLGTGQIGASFVLNKKQTLYYLFTQSNNTFSAGYIYAKKYKF